uniref:Glutaredoxin n=2 Tax=Rhizophora mucronata TaxID=61149 RepID=A0A2P2JP23_RHIMU
MDLILCAYDCSKSYCGYCYRVRQLLTSLGASFHVIELDERNDGHEMQSALVQWTGLRTVPNVFIGGKHTGGCDTLQHKYRKGELLPLLNEAGAVADKKPARS